MSSTTVDHNTPNPQAVAACDAICAAAYALRLAIANLRRHIAPPEPQEPITLKSLGRPRLETAFREISKQRGLVWARGAVGDAKTLPNMTDDAIRAALVGVDLTKIFT